MAGALFVAAGQPVEVAGADKAASTGPDGAKEVSCRQQPDRAAYCPALCAPAKMVFLPCMAVGAPAMAACREREIDACLGACARRGETC